MVTFAHLCGVNMPTVAVPSCHPGAKEHGDRYCGVFSPNRNINISILEVLGHNKMQ